MTTKCSVDQCGKLATLLCSRCQITIYCSKQCQSLHWKEHKKSCPLGDRCANCNKKSEGAGYQKCGYCTTVSYCSRECQTTDWQKHRFVCLRPEITMLDTLDPYFVIALIAINFIDLKVDLSLLAGGGAEVIIKDGKFFGTSLASGPSIDEILGMIKITPLVPDEAKLLMKTGTICNLTTISDRTLSLAVPDETFLIMCIYKRGWVMTNVGRRTMETTIERARSLV